MKNFSLLFFAIIFAALTACADSKPANPTVAISSAATLPSTPLPTTQPNAPQPTATPGATVAPSPRPGALVCPSNTPLAASAQLAARVNGVGISLDSYNRQVAQAQAAMSSQGLDPNSAAGKEQLKSLKLQVLDQLIKDVVIVLQAEKEGVKFSDNDLNARLAQMAQDAGGVDKLNGYFTQNQMTLADFCSQLRTQIVGEAMFNRVVSTLPEREEQVHVRHIIVDTAALAQQILTQIRQGRDFATLAKQYSKDEASKSNGGDLGWIPRGTMDPQFETIAFQLRPGQVSEVVQTQFGFHVIKLEERDPSRALQPEFLQNKRQQSFLVWLQAAQDAMKVERLVQP